MKRNPAFPFLGGDEGTSGIIEIKCPYTARDMTIDESFSHSNFSLHETDGEISLKMSHAFFFQVQGQFINTGVNFCDFLVFTRKEIHIERIHPDVDLM